MINLKNYELKRLGNNAYIALLLVKKVLICVLGGLSRVNSDETRVPERDDFVNKK